ncbi:unnamed protein product, partial [Adineta steineri]
NTNPKWTSEGYTFAGGNSYGQALNQLYYPRSIFIVDNDPQSIYIADTNNHRIVEWKYNASNGQVVAGGNGRGNRIDQLSDPTDVFVDQKNDSLIICDQGNRRIIRWFLQNQTDPQIIISNISCGGLAVDNNGDLYVSDYNKNEVRRWSIEDINSTIVAGGNGKGQELNQLNYPTRIFVDRDYSVYVSDAENYRVMKWIKDAEEGIIVAGSRGGGTSLDKMYMTNGVIVDHLDNVYVSDMANNRVIRWAKGSQEGSIIVGGNGSGNQSNQFIGPRGLSFDQQGNLFVVDMYNSRVQKFNIDIV